MGTITEEHTSPGIIPSYLLARLAQHGGDTYPRAARAAKRTLLAGRPPYRSRGVLELGLDEDGNLTAELSDAPDRTISDAQGQEVLPGVRVRGEDDGPVDDNAVNEAFDGLGITFDLLLKAFDRNSLDGAGRPLLATVHYGQQYDNAFWNGDQMVFGDGDGEVFLGFTRSVSVIGHELAHGVVETASGLEYQGESGALNESVADVFGVMTDQYAHGHTSEEATWLIGAALFGPDVTGRALRDMLHPGTAYDDDALGTDPQPNHMSNYVNTVEDNGGVHINSGIPNRAFALTALALGGHSWERAGLIWYRALTSGLRTTATFREFADATVAASIAEYGDNSEPMTAVLTAWQTVGVLGAGTTS